MRVFHLYECTCRVLCNNFAHWPPHHHWSKWSSVAAPYVLLDFPWRPVQFCSPRQFGQRSWINCNYSIAHDHFQGFPFQDVCYQVRKKNLIEQFGEHMSGIFPL